MQLPLNRQKYEQSSDIPANIKSAAGLPDIVNAIGDYFSDEIINGLINQMKESEMYSAMITLIKDSDLNSNQKQELLQYTDPQKLDNK